MDADGGDPRSQTKHTRYTMHDTESDTTFDEPTPTTIEEVAEKFALPVQQVCEHVSDDLQRTREHSAEVVEQRPIVEEHEDYLVVRASEASETPLEVQAVYRRMVDDTTEFSMGGHPLIVPRDALDEATLVREDGDLE